MAAAGRGSAPMGVRASKVAPPRQSHTHGHGHPHGDHDKKKALKSSRRGRRNLHQAKVRVHLPPIESYERELEYPAEAPGRVVVRLERLMGTDHVRLTDTKYMATLLERLEEEERRAWTKRRIERIKVEKDRFRKLAIDGLMEPGPDMQDLYQHPVFRVNRVLNRLAKMDTNITLTPHDKLPPIIEVDPFLNDDTGAAFKKYPGHSAADTERRTGHSISEHKDVTSDYFAATDEDEEMEGEGAGESNHPHKHPDEFFDESSHHHPIRQRSRAYSGTTTGLPSKDPTFPELSVLQAKYGIPPEVDLEQYAPYRSPLVDSVFHDDALEGILKLYEDAEMEGEGAGEHSHPHHPVPVENVEMEGEGGEGAGEYSHLHMEMEGEGADYSHGHGGVPATGMLRMYTRAEQVLGVYEREVMVGDDFVSELNKIMRGAGAT